MTNLSIRPLLMHCTQIGKEMLFGMSAIMQRDATRRFVLGFSIEYLYIRMWYCDRSGFFVSDLLDISLEVS